MLDKAARFFDKAARFFDKAARFFDKAARFLVKRHGSALERHRFAGERHGTAIKRHKAARIKDFEGFHDFSPLLGLSGPGGDLRRLGAGGYGKIRNPVKRHKAARILPLCAALQRPCSRKNHLRKSKDARARGRHRKKFTPSPHRPNLNFIFELF